MYTPPRRSKFDCIRQQIIDDNPEQSTVEHYRLFTTGIFQFGGQGQPLLRNQRLVFLQQHVNKSNSIDRLYPLLYVMRFQCCKHKDILHHVQQSGSIFLSYGEQSQFSSRQFSATHEKPHRTHNERQRGSELVGYVGEKQCFLAVGIFQFFRLLFDQHLILIDFGGTPLYLLLKFQLPSACLAEPELQTLAHCQH